MLDIDASENFDSVQLNEDFRQLGLGQDEHKFANRPPPSKRRKLQSRPSLLDELTINICALLGSEKKSNLAALDQIAE